MPMTFTPTVQGVVDSYERSLRSVRGLFDLYPVPRPQGAPQAKFRPLPPAIVQGVTAGFESFAEERPRPGAWCNSFAFSSALLLTMPS